MPHLIGQIRIVRANYSHFFLRMQGSRARWYYDQEDMEKVGRAYYRKVKRLRQLSSLELLKF